MIWVKTKNRREMAESGIKDVRDLLAYVEKRGLLRRIKTPVKREFEIAEITSRAAHLPGGGPALFFENVVGSAMPVLTNLVGSAQRLAWSFSLNRLSELEQPMLNLLNPSQPHDLGERLLRLGETSHLARYAPRLLKTGLCQEVVHNGEDAKAAFKTLPILQAWPGESGPVIRSLPVFSRAGAGQPMVVTSGHLVCSPEGLYLDGLMLQPGERRSVALVIGGDPALLFTARAPFLPGLDPLMLAGGLTRRRVELVRCKTSDLEVPASAEIVLEGQIEAVSLPTLPQLAQLNGHYGPLVAPARFTLSALTHRPQPLFVTSVVAPPPHEEAVLVKGSERLLLPLLKLAAPEITELCLPTEGAFYNLAIVSIRKTYPGQARKVIYNLWGREQLRHLKNILVVDADCDIHQPSQVAARLLSLLDPAHDMLVAPGPLDPGDLINPTSGYGPKLGLDATRKLAGEGPVVSPLTSSEQTRQLVDTKWLEYGLE